jgi:hypothetical protein
MIYMYKIRDGSPWGKNKGRRPKGLMSSGCLSHDRSIMHGGANDPLRPVEKKKKEGKCRWYNIYV